MLHLCSRPKNGGQLIILLTAFDTFMTVSVCALYFLAEVRPALPYPVRYRFFAESAFYYENGNSFSLCLATFYGHQVRAQLNEGFFTRGSVCVCVRVYVCV